MMNETTTEDRRSRLDEFAEMAPQANVPMVTIMPAAPARLDIPHGAIKVQEKRNQVAIAARLREMAAMLGQRGYYTWEVNNKKKGTKDVVEGVSIKGANALVRAYGNCHVSCPLVVDLGTHWRFHAVFVDFETGVELERSFIQRKNTGGGMGDNAERSVDMSYQVGVSKAERNVVLNVLDVEADFLLEECKQNLVRKIGKDPDYWRNRVIERLAERSIDLQRVEAVVGRPINDWLARDIAKVIAGIRAIVDGFVLADDAFPPLQSETRQPAAELDALVAASSESPAPNPAAGDQGDPGPLPPSGSPTLKQEAIDKFLALATDKDLSTEQRLEAIDLGLPNWDDVLAAPEFLAKLQETVVKVANGKLKAIDARKYLEAMTAK